MCRGVEQSGQLGWLITNRSLVQIQPPLPRKDFDSLEAFLFWRFFSGGTLGEKLAHQFASRDAYHLAPAQKSVLRVGDVSRT